MNVKFDTLREIKRIEEKVLKDTIDHYMKNIKMEAEPKYKVGEKIKVSNWTGETEPLEILDIQRTYHHRLEEYCWGYKMDGYTGLTMTYVPEGYLRP